MIKIVLTVIMGIFLYAFLNNMPETGDSEGLNRIQIADSIFDLSDYYSNNPALDARVDEIYNSLSDGQKVSQLIISSAGSNGKSTDEVMSLVKDDIIGGVILLGGSSDGLKIIAGDLQGTSLPGQKIPLLISTDGEPSLINRKISDIPAFPKTNTISTTEDARSIALEIAGILTGMNIYQNYAPVCDYGYNKEIISSRSFGGPESNVGNLAAEFIKATQEAGVIATAKHFPGHGNVSGDSHNKVVYISGELKEIHIFKDAIDAGVISVMAGHIAIKNNPNYNTNGLPATLSGNIIEGLLRDELGFKGIVVTDAMNMGAVTNIKDASYKAFLAGCDLILMEPDERKLHSRILSEMASNEETAKRVEESVKRIIRAKLCLNLD